MCEDIREDTFFTGESIIFIMDYELVCWSEASL